MEFLYRSVPGSVRSRQAVFALLTLLVGAAFLHFVDLTPRVEGDFFFSTDDPAIQVHREIRSLFPSSPQLILSAHSPDIRSVEYGTRIHTLSLKLLDVEGVDDVVDIRHGPWIEVL